MKEILDSLEKISDEIKKIKDFVYTSSFVKKGSIMDLIKSNEWPVAVESELICDLNSEEDKINRAEGIITTFVGDIKGKKFLDFGCGEGYCVKIAEKQGAIAFGYDLGQDFEVIKSNAPFDFILLYDVLDHAKSPSEALNQVKLLSTKETKIFVRFHPWCSRHGGHLYHNLNKAFAHLFLTEEELNELGCEFNQKVFFPIDTYHKWIESAGFEIVSQEIERNFVEPFFSKNQLIQKYLKIEKFGLHQMEQCFLDTVIKIK